MGEGEREWKATEEEKVEGEAAEELSGGGLEIRQRKKGEMGREREEKVGNGEENSVYLEADEGIFPPHFCTFSVHKNIKRHIYPFCRAGGQF